MTATAPTNAPAAAPILPQIQNPESTLPDDPLSASVNVAPNLNENSEISEAAQSVQNAAATPENYVMTYTYNANNRMTKQKKAENGIENITKMGYDKNGNMTSRQRSSIGGPVGENTNMEVSIGTMQSNPGSESVAETFSYNVLNQMVGYQNSDGTNASYTYDATGMRTGKTVNGVEKKFYYDGMYIINEGDSTEINVTNFVGLTGIEGRQNGADEMAYFMKDAHGDVIKILDSEDFRADYEYDIWGNQTQDTTNTFDNPFRYCSEYMDEESGLMYLRARYYDSNTGRFTSSDPHWNTDNMIYGDKQNAVKYVLTDDNKIYYDKYGNIVKIEGYQIKNLEPILKASRLDPMQTMFDVLRIPDNKAIVQSSNLYTYAINNPISNVDYTGEYYEEEKWYGYRTYYTPDEAIELANTLQERVNDVGSGISLAGEIGGDMGNAALIGASIPTAYFIYIIKVLRENAANGYVTVVKLTPFRTIVSAERGDKYNG